MTRIWLLLYLAGAFQGPLLAIALWRREANRPANRILAVWIIVVSLDLALRSGFLGFEPSATTVRAYGLAQFLPFVHGSFFYLYVRGLTRNQAFQIPDLVHLAGFVVALAVNGQLLAGSPVEIMDTISGRTGGILEAITFGPFLFGYSVVYLAMSLRLIIEYRRRCENRESGEDPGGLRWLRLMIAWQLAIWAIAALVSFPIPFPVDLSHRAIYAAVAAWVLVVAYRGLAQDQIPTLNAETVAVTSDTDDDRLVEVMASVDQAIAEGIHFKPALTIAQLSRQVGYPEYLVSMAINQTASETYRQFINRHRVTAAADRLIATNDGVLDIAYEVGFTAKSTFNNAFKQVHGVTPSQYRARANADRSRPDRG